MAPIDQNAALSFSDQFKLLDDRTINVDLNGDIILAVHQGDDDDESKTFRVSSQVMRLASSHWRNMLDVELGFQEATTTGTISLHEDNIQAVFLVLLASHLRFQDVPEKLTFTELYELCVTCDKYFCIGVMRPWIYGWMSPWKTKAVDAELARIAWVTNETKQCLNQSEEVIDEILPPGLPDTILKASYTIFVVLIEFCHSMVYNYEFSGGVSLCKGEANQDECDALIYGHLVRQLQKLALWPGNPKDMADTLEAACVDKLVSDIKSIKSYLYPQKTRDPYGHTLYDDRYGHYSCGCATQLHKEADELVNRAGSELIESSRKQLETRWKELGGSKMDLSKFQT